MLVCLTGNWLEGVGFLLLPCSCDFKVSKTAGSGFCEANQGKQCLIWVILQTSVPVGRRLLAEQVEQVEQLQCGYTYVQGAVYARQLDFVVDALEALCSGS
jgi:hypothetical protein